MLIYAMCSFSVSCCLLPGDGMGVAQADQSASGMQAVSTNHTEAKSARIRYVAADFLAFAGHLT